jgi:hypothetical protein
MMVPTGRVSHPPPARFPAQWSADAALLDRGDVMAEFFAYAVDKRLAPFYLPFGFRPSKDGVTITDDGTFRATLGFVKLETPLGNIAEAHVTRNYRWWTAAGARGSMVDDGLTLGTNRNAGVCVHFREPVPSRLRRKGHSAITVTVADVDGLVHRLQR